MDVFSNETATFLDLTSAVNYTIRASPRHVSTLAQVLITFFYCFGISANVCALVLLWRGETIRNHKQTLMVRCLACNDLVALLGSFMLMYMQLYMRRDLVRSRWFCALRVILRTFGLSSGCVAVVMAAERWMALTRPFLYQKHVTQSLIKRAIFSLWLSTLLLVCLPLAGFGLYYDKDRCSRYRSGRTPFQAAYAYLMFGTGSLLCLVIVACNLAVVQALCRMGRKSNAHCGRTTVRKDSKELAFNHTTPEELSFAKLMVVLCVFFVVCWVPQMITILIAQLDPEHPSRHPFYRIADICMALNFTLDPVVYVLSRRPHRRGLRRLLKPLCHSCSPPMSLKQSSKTTKEVNQNSTSNTSQKDCIILEQMNPKFGKKIPNTQRKNADSSPPLLKEDLT